eukprot:363658-Chlamydomonas_euryale.AAC.8
MHSSQSSVDTDRSIHTLQPIHVRTGLALRSAPTGSLTPRSRTRNPWLARVSLAVSYLMFQPRPFIYYGYGETPW